MIRNGVSLALFLLLAFTLLVPPLAAQNSVQPPRGNQQTPSSQNGNSDSTASPAPGQTSPSTVDSSDTSTTPGYAQPATTTASTDPANREPVRTGGMSWAGGLIGLAIGFVIGYMMGNRRPVTDIRRDRAA